VRKVFEAADPAEAGLVQGLLEDAGIPCVLRNEQVSQAIPTAAFFPEVWVGCDADHDRAVEVIAAWNAPSKGGGRAWACTGCGESIEEAFDSCWNCGRERASGGGG
jgi:hypothetical protein